MGGARCGVAPEDQRRREFGRKNGSIQGIIDGDRGRFSRRLVPLGDSAPSQNREHECPRNS